MTEFILGIAVGLVLGVAIEAFVFKPTTQYDFSDRVEIILHSLACILIAGTLIFLAFVIVKFVI